jgi:hypothetical protein
LNGARCRNGIARPIEDRQDAVALTARTDNLASVVINQLADEFIVATQRAVHIHGVSYPASDAVLDLGEQKR